MSRDLIVFGEDFGGLPSSTQHIVSRLAKDRKILWVNSIGLRQPKFNTNDVKRAVGKLLGLSKRGYSSESRPHPSNITIVNLKTIPAPKSTWARTIAKTMLLTQLKPIIDKLKLVNPILWTSLPTAADLCGHLGETAVVYYCGDDFASLAGVDHHTISTHENKLANIADLILGASPAICRKFDSTKTTLITHGVDYELFSQSAKRASDLPSNGRPIAGFYGSISNWLDYELIAKICLSNSNWDFVFIGPIELGYNPLPNLSNVYYLGPKPHHQLPSYSQHWDASLLPFKLNQQIMACSPLKLMEYLAAGTPVITTPFPALERYKPYVNLVNDESEFKQALDDVMVKQKGNSEIVRSESWDARTQTVNRLLESL
ncbi:glycosyl transferase [Vibrio zhanjiangensis]|uniref:Glycosyl transferase n=1 Tax=Vibrio zhanjiangensis TaxID=1046128 RepID=A0ABQ6F227_9VIBR|nr:glycosyltransferase [Vibrio zhanjiangensis]GLT18915.1 glycosyl transferase [Vibrio zhanjiangensis]